MIEKVIEFRPSRGGLTIASSKEKSPKPLETLRILSLVPVTGLEPVRHRWRWILSPLRLPFHHTGVCANQYITNQRKMQEKFFRAAQPAEEAQ